MKKQKIKRYGFPKALCILLMVFCLAVMVVFINVGAFAKPQMEAGRMPSLAGHTYIAVTDDQLSDVLNRNALVFGTVKSNYHTGDVVAVRLSVSELVSVTPNTDADIALVQIVSFSEDQTAIAVAYNDINTPFWVGTDAILCGIDTQLNGFGYLFSLMLVPMSFLFFLILPLLLIVLCIVILAFLKEKTVRSIVEFERYQEEQEPLTEQQRTVPLTTPKKASAASEEATVEKGEHPLLSGREDEMVFPKLVDNDEVAQQIARKIAIITEQEEKQQQELTEQLDHAMKRMVSEPIADHPLPEMLVTGDTPAQPKTTVVYQVGEQQPQIRNEVVDVSDDDLDLMLLQDKIESIIHNNNRRLEDEVEQKMRGVATEKEKAQRELEKTREFFISPAHLAQRKK